MDHSGHEKSHRSGHRTALQSGRYSGLPIVEDGGTVIGVVTEYDLLKAVQEGLDLQSTTADELMTPVPYCVDESATLDGIMGKMTLKNVICLSIVRDGKPVEATIKVDQFK